MILIRSVKALSSKILRVSPLFACRKTDKTFPFRKKRPPWLTTGPKLFTLTHRRRAGFLTLITELQLLASTFVPNGPHCCWLLDRQTDPLARRPEGLLLDTSLRHCSRRAATMLKHGSQSWFRDAKNISSPFLLLAG